MNYIKLLNPDLSVAIWQMFLLGLMTGLIIVLIWIGAAIIAEWRAAIIKKRIGPLFERRMNKKLQYRDWLEASRKGKTSLTWNEWCTKMKGEKHGEN